MLLSILWTIRRIVTFLFSTRAIVYHRLNGSSITVLTATHHSYGSLAWLSDCFFFDFAAGPRKWNGLPFSLRDTGLSLLSTNIWRLTYSLSRFETTAHLWHLGFLRAVYKFNTYLLTYSQWHSENSWNKKNGKMVIIFSQHSTFRRYAAKVLSPFSFSLFSMCHCAVKWCDRAYVFAFIKDRSNATEFKLWQRDKRILNLLESVVNSKFRKVLLNRITVINFRIINGGCYGWNP